MESQPQNPEFRINPENFHQCSCIISAIGYLILLVIYFSFAKFYKGTCSSNKVQNVLPMKGL